MHQAKRKKDFKLREDLVKEFERLAPSGKQTAIVETLLHEWVRAQKLKARNEEIRKAYERKK